MTACVRTAVICGLIGLAGCRLDLDKSGGTTSTSPSGPPQRGDDASSGAAGGGSNRSGSAMRDPNDKGVDCPASFAGPPAAAPPMAANGVTTFRGYVQIKGEKSFNGTVVIEPGTTFVMEADSALSFGAFGARTTLDARGTPENTIRFCGVRSTPGFWRSISFGGAVTSDSVLENVVIRGAGSKDAAVFTEAPLRFTNVTIHASKSAGVSASKFGDGSSGLTVEGGEGDALILSTQGALEKLPTKLSLQGNKSNVIRLTYRSIADGAHLVFHDYSAPYIQNTDVIVHGGAVLDFDPGVELQFAADTGMELAWNSGKAELHVNGTEDAPVIFRGVNATKGAWKGVSLNAGLAATSTISHWQILHGGAGKSHPLVLHSKVPFNDVLVKDATRGVYIDVQQPANSRGLTVTGVDSYPLELVDGGLLDLPKGSLTGNAIDMAHVANAGVLELAGSLNDLGVPYLVSDQISLSNASDVTIEAGVELIYTGDYTFGLEVGWNGGRAKLVAAGTASAPIVLRGEVDAVGTWKGLSLNNSASPASKLDHVQVRNAGIFVGPAIPVTNTNVSKSPGFGISHPAQNMTDYQTSNTFSDNGKGDVGAQ